MRRTPVFNLAFFISLALTVPAAPLHASETAPLPASKAVAELGRDLGLTIQLKGGAGRSIALPDSGGAPETRIARLAADLTGAWKRVLRLSEKASQAAPVSAELERSVTLGFSDLPANKALAIIARQMGAEWDPALGPTRRVTLSGVSRTVRELLDEVTRQAGVSWTLEYRIDAPDAEVISVLQQPEAPRSKTATPPAQPTPDITVAVIPTIPPPAAWTQSLKGSVLKLLKASPDRRQAALDSFLREMGTAAVFLQAVPIERRASYRAAGSKLYDQWSRLYGGLAPTVRAELDPADGVMRDLLGK